MTTGQRIRALRKQRGLTQEQLGALCGMTGGAISSYENGVTAPRRRVVERIAGALDVPAGRLMEATAAIPREESREAGDALLCGGVLAVLRDLYGAVEGRVIVGENGSRRRYYVVRQASGDFILREDDIDAIARSAKASLPPMAEYLRRLRGASA